jgi:hypothetical protein
VALAPDVGSTTGGGDTRSTAGSYSVSGRLQQALLAPLCSSKCDQWLQMQRRGLNQGWPRWQRYGNSGEVATAAIGAKGGSFPSIRITGETIDAPAATKGHGGVHTATR